MSTSKKYYELIEFRNNYFLGKEINTHLEKTLKYYGFYTDFKLGEFERFDFYIENNKNPTLNKTSIQESNRTLKELKYIKSLEEEDFKGRVFTRDTISLLKKHNRLKDFQIKKPVL